VYRCIVYVRLPEIPVREFTGIAHLINDLDCDVTNWILKFADGTKIFGPVCNQKFQEDLNRLFSWTKDWQMSFNIDKCKVMHIGRSSKTYNYSLDGLVLKEAEIEKDWGMMISNYLKVSHQCLSAYNKANRILRIINRTIVYKTKEIMFI